MAQALQKLPQQSDPRLLVGNNTADDAGVFRLDNAQALVLTVDLLTPVVPDAYTFGAIAAANCLSDVYAMGGEPLVVLNIMGFPAAGNRQWLVEILRGAQDKVLEAGACVAGGHTFNDPEVKFGLAVTGMVNPMRIVTNARARPGDRLVLTKPLGTGTLSQALMTTDEIPQQLLSQGIEVMQTLNRAAAEVMLEMDVVCATDITGFGLIGHAQELAQASGVAVRFNTSRLPVLPMVLDLISQGILNSGIAMNEASFHDKLAGSKANTAELSERDRAMLYLMYESQSSGGLLIAVDSDRTDELCRRLQLRGIVAPVIGEVVAGQPGTVIVEE